MPYCHNCGKPVNETDRFCASCFVELFLRDSPHNGVRRFPTPLPEQTRTRLLTPDSKGTEQVGDYGKTRLIDYGSKETESTPVSGKTRLINPDREESEPTPVSGKTRLIDYDREESQLTPVSGKTRLIGPDREESEPTLVSGKTRLIDDSNKEGLVAEDIPPSKSFPQQTESFKTRLISDSEHPDTTKTAGKQVSVTTINPFEFETARMNARKYKKARNTWLILAIIFFCATGAFVPLYVVTYDEAMDYQWMYNDTKNKLYKILQNYEVQLGIKQVEEAKTEKEVAAERVETAEEENARLKAKTEAKERELAEAQAARDAAAAAAFR